MHADVRTDTNNIIHDKNGGYEHVSEYISIGQPNAGTLAKLDELRASETAGDRTLTLVPHDSSTQPCYLSKISN